MAVRSKTSAKQVSGALAKASGRVLSHEERLARASASVLRTAGLAAAKRFERRAEASLVAAAGDGGWTPPHEDELIDVDAIVAALRGKSDPIRQSAIEDYGSTLRRLAPEIDWDVTNPLVGGVLAGSAQHVRGIADTTRINLMRIVRRSYEEGLSIEDTGKAIRVGMTEASKVRGRLIARTEMAAVSNGGSLAATKLLADSGGGPYFKRWMTAPGAHYPRHEDYEGLDGQTVALDDAFDVGGYALQFPGDPDGPPEEICNCRCALAFVESQDEPLPGEPDGPPEMPAADEGDLPLEAVDGDTAPELAGDLAANAAAMEPYVTGAIQAATEPLGGHLQGFEYRFKSESSLARKIETDVGARLPGLPAPIAASAIKDALRYTVLYRPGEYADKMTKTLDALKAAGIEAERVRASWARGVDYAGTNAIMRTPNGYRFELQFHTPQSYNVKEFVNHDDYEVWRKVADKSSPEALALSKKMSTASDDVRRPAGIESWTYDGSVHGDIGITPFREGVDDPIGFYDSEKFARFERDAHDLADHYGVSLDQQERATGVWEGAEEPSVHLSVHDGEVGVRAYAAALGRAYRQDGVAIFTADNGDAVVARFATEGIGQERIYEAMARAELPAGRFLPDGSFEVIGGGPEFVAQANALSRDLGVGYDGYVGRFDLLEAGSGDYEKAIADGQGAGAVKAGQAGRGAPGLPGGPAVREGAEGAEGGAGALGGRSLPAGELDRDLSKARDFPTAVGAAAGEDEEALSIVLGGDGVATQAALRTGDVPDWMRADLKTIDAIIARNRVGEEGAVSIRGVHDLADTPFGGLPRVGAEAFDPAYGSTSLDPKVASSFAGSDPGRGYVTYHLPPGTPALYVPRITNAADEWGQKEKELLIPRGQTLRVIGVDEFKGVPNIHVELVEHPVSTAPPEVARPAALAPGSLKAPADVTPPASPPSWRPPYPPSEMARFGPDRLWGAHAEVGRLQNAARAELPELRDDRLVALLWEKGGRTRKGALAVKDVAGDAQSHSYFSDGHATVQQMAEEARLRGEQQLVVSDHSHLLTTAEIGQQHDMIDALNDDYRRRGSDFKILKGIEANILADGSLDVAPEVLARFDVVNAAIHAPIEGQAGQLALFKGANTERLLRALDNPELDVLVHPHSVAADWDAVATKAAQRGVALEVNGRDLLRNSRQEAAADMIAAARRHGAKLVLGSDAHNPGDLVDLLYAVRFASGHGVTFDDLAPIAQARRIGRDASESIPASFDASTSGRLARPLGGGMNEVWKVETEDGRAFVVKPKPDLELMREVGGFDSEDPLRTNISPGSDLERERAAFVFSRYFNEEGGEDFHVNVPAYRIGEFRREPFARIPFEEEPEFVGAARTDAAGIAEFIPGEEGRSVGEWQRMARDEEVRSAGLYDALIGNTDRHAGNFIFDEEDGNLWLIDHGLAFPRFDEAEQFQNEKLVDESVARFKRGLVPREVAFLERLRGRWDEIADALAEAGISDAEVANMRDRLDHLIESRTRRPWSVEGQDVFDEEDYVGPLGEQTEQPSWAEG